MGRDHPAIEVHAAWTDPPSLPLGDAVGAVVGQEGEREDGVPVGLAQPLVRLPVHLEVDLLLRADAAKRVALGQAEREPEPELLAVREVPGGARELAAVARARVGAGVGRRAVREVEGDAADACLANLVISDASGTALDAEVDGCTTIVVGGDDCSEGYDECGVCGGDNSSCADCAGVPNGDSVICWDGSCSLPDDCPDQPGGSVEVYYNSDTPIAGFQFNVEGVSVTGAAGGAAAAHADDDRAAVADALRLRRRAARGVVTLIHSRAGGEVYGLEATGNGVETRGSHRAITTPSGPRSHGIGRRGLYGVAKSS